METGLLAWCGASCKFKIVVRSNEEAYGKAGPLREAPYGEGRSLREGSVLAGGSLTGLARFTKKDDEEACSLREGPLRGDFLREGTFQEGRSLREGPVLMGESLTGMAPFGLPELGGNFRLCAVDQKRPFFPRAGPFLDLLPL